MQAQDRGSFSHYITSVLAFYKQDASSFVMDVWWAACEPYSLEQVRRAVTAHVTDPQRGQFAPKPADMVRALHGTHTDRAVAAWGKVHGAIVHVGAYKDVRFDEGIIHLVLLDLGGWPLVCRTRSDELGYLQHRFCEGYRAYACLEQQQGSATKLTGRSDRRGIAQAWPSYLAGDRSPDEFYEKHGLMLPPPVEIGDASKCAQVAKVGMQWRLPQPFDGDIANVSVFFGGQGDQEQMPRVKRTNEQMIGATDMLRSLVGS